MTAAALGFLAWSVAAFAVGALVGLCIRSADKRAPRVEPDAPDGTAGDLLADQPTEILLPVVPDYIPRTWVA